MTNGIYKITNKINGKTYIGQSNNCERRILEHQQERDIPIDMWINFLGKDNFTYEIIESCPLEELDEKELYYIKLYDSINNGYNILIGGSNNSIGEGNGRAKLKESDIIKIRKAYSNHENCKQVYEQFKDKIAFSHFQRIWLGKSWSNIMPEVFTEENKKYYTSGMNLQKSSLTKEEVLKYRKYYMNHSMSETYQLLCSDKGTNFLKESTFKKIIIGDVRENSIYKEIPVYKKTLKTWFLKGEPVSTILESEELGYY